MHNIIYNICNANAPGLPAQSPRHLAHEVLGGQARGSGHVLGALPVPKGVVYSLGEHACELVYSGLVLIRLAMQVGGVVHRADQSVNKAYKNRVVDKYEYKSRVKKGWHVREGVYIEHTHSPAYSSIAL